MWTGAVGDSGIEKGTLPRKEVDQVRRKLEEFKGCTVKRMGRLCHTVQDLWLICIAWANLLMFYT